MARTKEGVGTGMGLALEPFGAIAGTIPGAVIGGLTGNKVGSEIDRDEEK